MSKRPYNLEEIAQEGDVNESQDKIIAVGDQLREEEEVLAALNEAMPAGASADLRGLPAAKGSAGSKVAPSSTFVSRRELMTGKATAGPAVQQEQDSDGGDDDDVPAEVRKAMGVHKPSGPMGQSSRRLRSYDDDDSADEHASSYVQSEAGAELKYMNTQGQVVTNTPNPRFKNFSDVFKNLVKASNVPTMYPIVTMMITYDSTRATTVTKKDDSEWYIKQYDLESYEMTFEEKIGGQPGDYIRCREVEQNSKGDKYAYIYNNDGRWYVRTHGKTTRTAQEIQGNELDVNSLLGLDNHTMCTHIFPDPFGNCTFVTDTQLYICIFHNATLTHYHFLYDMEAKSMIGKPSKLEIDCTRKNFPYKSFYNEDEKEIYTFYRQGQSFTIKAEDTSDYKSERMTEMDLGEMYLVYNKALMARSSSDILCFKIEVDEDTGERSWVHYHTIPIRGFVYYIKGNIRIQVVEETKIYFFLVDKETLEVRLENCMANYMKCQKMMFGSKVKYGITYKANQRSFDVYRRRYQHDFLVPVNKQNLEGSVGLEFESMETYLLSKVDKILMYDVNNFTCYGEVPIKLLEADTREPNQVIAMVKCQNEQYLAVISGKNLIMNEQKTNQLFIFRRQQNPGGRDDFELYKKVVIKEMDEFKKTSMDFHFKQNGRPEKDSLIFAKIDKIFELNFETEQIQVLYRYTTRPLLRQPVFFKANADQSIFLISSPEDCVYCNMRLGQELDVDKTYGIEAIKAIIFDEEEHFFYVLCNKFQEKLGFFVLRLSETDPGKARFLIRWKNKSDIGDPYMVVLKDAASGIKELIIGYKVIYINVYRITAMDISLDDENLMLFTHESFQLWESECSGLLLSKNKDFVKVNKSGMHILSLGFQEKKAIQDETGMDWMCHSLEGYNFLKIAPDNYLYFSDSKPKETIVRVDQELETSNKREGNETKFFPVFRVKFTEATLRELLLFQSLYVCKTLSEIIDIVDDQPDPTVFYKSFLELNGTNMTSILSFDSRSMAYLLNDRFADHFDENYPLFYKNKFAKGKGIRIRYFYRSAIDNALKNNQVGAVNEIINYIVKFQNSFTSSYLFTKNIAEMVEGGICISELLNSDVFHYQFDYDEWPGTHVNDETAMRPYNDSIFKLRNNYSTILPGEAFAPIDDEDDESGKAKKKHDSSKIYKIQYSVNLLPMLGMYVETRNNIYTGDLTRDVVNPDVNFLGICAEAEEIDMFDCQLLQDLIEFKWQGLGFATHLVGFCVHAAYMAYLFFYTQEVYIRVREGEKVSEETQHLLTFILLVPVSYPLIYESAQAFNGGVLEYLSDGGNYIDMTYIFGSVAMSFVHYFEGPRWWVSRLLMALVCMLAIRRTFHILKIFKNFSPIITMILEVFTGLTAFGTVFLVMILLFSLNLGVIGWNDPLKNPLFMEKNAPEELLAAGSLVAEFEDIRPYEDMPDREYAYVGKFLGNFMTQLRLSMGDFDIGPVAALQDRTAQAIYLIYWMFSLFISNIIFLNFIVAEASAFYDMIAEKLAVYIQQNRASLVAEAEGLLPDSAVLRFAKCYPKYIVQRTIAD